MNSNRKKPAEQSNFEAIVAAKESLPPTIELIPEKAIQKADVSQERSDAHKKAFADLMKQTFGTDEVALHKRFLDQAARAVSDLRYQGKDESVDYLLAAVGGMAPKDALEGMLAVQMVALHSLAMEYIGRAASSKQSDVGVEICINRAMKLMRVFASHTETLGRYRGKGEQKMSVEHVHVYKGGQAIVGQSQLNTQLNSKNGGGNNEGE